MFYFLQQYTVKIFFASKNKLEFFLNMWIKSSDVGLCQLTNLFEKIMDIQLRRMVVIIKGNETKHLQHKILVPI